MTWAPFQSWSHGTDEFGWKRRAGRWGGGRGRGWMEAPGSEDLRGRREAHSGGPSRMQPGVCSGIRGGSLCWGRGEPEEVLQRWHRNGAGGWKGEGPVDVTERGMDPCHRRRIFVDFLESLVLKASFTVLKGWQAAGYLLSRAVSPPAGLCRTF